MVLVLTTPPTMLFSAITYTLSHYKNEDVVLFVHKELFRSRGLIQTTENLKNKGIFKDIVYSQTLHDNKNIKNKEEYINDYLEYFDKLFADSGYSLKNFDDIICINDDWDGHFNLYLNLKNIKYHWIQIVKNNLLDIYVSRFSKNMNDLMNEYKALSGLANYAIPILRKDSTANISLLRDSHFIERDINEELHNITDDDLHTILNCYDFNYSEKLIENTSLVIMNSLGYAKWKSESNSKTLKAKRLSGWEDYSDKDIFSKAYSMANDFYIDDSIRNFFVKSHPNDPLTEKELVGYFGKKAKNFNNAPFEFISEFLLRNNYSFSNIIGIASTSLENIKNIAKLKYVLGDDYFKTFYFYCSLYGIMRIVVELNYSKIYLRPFIKTQLNLLFQKNNFSIEQYQYLEAEELLKVKGAFILIDSSFQNIDESEFKKIAQNNTIGFINAEFLSNKNLISILENCIPIEIEKHIREKRTADSIYRNEHIWIYDRNDNIKNKIRNFHFEKSLYSTGIDISSKILNVQQKYELIDKLRMRFVCDRFDELENKYLKLRDFVDTTIIHNNDPALHSEYLKNINDIDYYFKVLSRFSDKYTILLSTKDTPGNNIPQSVLDILHSIGFSKLSKKLWLMYSGIIQNGDILYDMVGSKPEEAVNIKYYDSSTENEFVISSNAWKKENKSEIIINGVNYSANVRGINIVVYDRNNKKVIDSIGYDAHVHKPGFKHISF